MDEQKNSTVENNEEVVDNLQSVDSIVNNPLQHVVEQFQSGNITEKEYKQLVKLLGGNSNTSNQAHYTRKTFSKARRKMRNNLTKQARRGNRYKSQRGQKQSGRY